MSAEQRKGAQSTQLLVTSLQVAEDGSASVAIVSLRFDGPFFDGMDVFKPAWAAVLRDCAPGTVRTCAPSLTS